MQTLAAEAGGMEVAEHAWVVREMRPGAKAPRYETEVPPGLSTRRIRINGAIAIIVVLRERSLSGT